MQSIQLGIGVNGTLTGPPVVTDWQFAKSAEVQLYNNVKRITQRCLFSIEYSIYQDLFRHTGLTHHVVQQLVGGQVLDLHLLAHTPVHAEAVESRVQVCHLATTTSYNLGIYLADALNPERLTLSKVDTSIHQKASQL